MAGFDVFTRTADAISVEEREICERYGEQCIGSMLASGHTPTSKELQILFATETSRLHARDWLAEAFDINDWHSTRDLLLELLIVLLIGLELVMAYQQGKRESQNFKDQQTIQSNNFNAQEAVLTNLQSSSKSTADILSTMDGKMKQQVDLATETRGLVARGSVAAEKQSENLVRQSSILTSLDLSSSSTASTLSRQLDDFEAAERASLVIEKFEVVWPQQPASSSIQIDCSIRNVGVTTATELSVSRSGGGGPVDGRPTATRHGGIALNFPISVPGKPNPGDGGPSLGSGQPYDCSWSQSVSAQDDPWLEQVRQGKAFQTYTVSASYKDVFGKPWIVNDCMIFQPWARAFIRCEMKPDQ